MQCCSAVMKLNVKSSCSILAILSDGGGWSQPNFITWRKKTKQLFPTFQQCFYCTEPFSQYIIDKPKRAQQPLIPDTNIWFKDFLVIFFLSVVRNKTDHYCLVFLCSMIFLLIQKNYTTFVPHTQPLFLWYFFCQTPCREQLKASFDNFIAKHPQGCITRKDFRGIMKNCFPQHNYEVLEKRIFNMYDANQVRLFCGNEVVNIFFAMCNVQCTRPTLETNVFV